MSLSLAVIIGSTRPGRIGPKVGAWVERAARAHARFNVTLVDLAELSLPLLDEPRHPSKKEYEHEHTKRWSALADVADAFVFVTPEYDFFPPASVVNAVQVLSQEWKYKPAGVVCYGGISGGFRSAQELRLLLSNVNVMAIPATVALHSVHSLVDEAGVLAPTESHERGFARMLDELARWGEALRPLRAQAK